MTGNTDARGRRTLLVIPVAVLLGAFSPAFAQDPLEAAGRPALLLSAAADRRSPTGVAIPRDLAAALDELDRLLPADRKRELGSDAGEGPAPSAADLVRWIQVNWGLWQGSVLSRWFQGQGVLSPDDMGALIITAYRGRLAGSSPEMASLLEGVGVRSLTAASLPAVEIGEGKKKQTFHRFAGWGAAIDLPPGWLVRVQEKERTGRDGFALAFFFPSEKGVKQLLGAYSGGHPGFPAGVPPTVRIRKGTFAGAPAEWSEWKHDGRWNREIKLELPGNSPSWLHLWYHDLGDSERKDAERILSRLRLVW